MEERIKVAVRIRPENIEKSNIYQSDIDKNVVVINSESTNNKADEHSFKFDSVYHHLSKQEDIFNDMKELVLSSIDGYNATIFAFGMTGSGKTHTISGDRNDPGIVPRSVVLIFAEIEKRSRLNPNEVCIPYLSCIELYNNVLYDLLEKPANSNGTSNNSVFNGNFKPTSLKLFEHPVKGVTVTGTKSIRTPVTGVKDTMELIQIANNRRSVNSTNCNDRSSRSHCVYKLEFLFHEITNTHTNTNTNPNTDTNTNIDTINNTTDGDVCRDIPNHTIIKHSCVNFVDLAGSENVKVSGATGETLEEAKQINKALSILGDVLNALSKNNSNCSSGSGLNRSLLTTTTTVSNATPSTFIPYRSSKLTMLLKDSLGGNSKTLMIATIRPSVRDYSQSLMTLRYAARTRNIVCTPRLNITIHDTGHSDQEKSKEERDKDIQMQAVLEEVSRLKLNLVTQQVEFDNLRQQKCELDALVGSYEHNANTAHSNANANANAKEVELERLFEKNKAETLLLKEQLQHVVMLQDQKLMEQAQEYHSNLASERNHASKTMLALTKEKSIMQNKLQDTRSVVIPELTRRIEELTLENEKLAMEKLELEEQMNQVLENCGEEQKLWEDYARCGYEKERLEFVQMLQKVSASRNKYKEQASQLELEIATKNQLQLKCNCNAGQVLEQQSCSTSGGSSVGHVPMPNNSSNHELLLQIEKLSNALDEKDQRVVTLQSQLESSMALNHLSDTGTDGKMHMNGLVELESINIDLKKGMVLAQEKESKLETLVRKMSNSTGRMKKEIQSLKIEEQERQLFILKKEEEIKSLTLEMQIVQKNYQCELNVFANEIAELKFKAIVDADQYSNIYNSKLEMEAMLKQKDLVLTQYERDYLEMSTRYMSLESEFECYRAKNTSSLLMLDSSIRNECTDALSTCIAQIEMGADIGMGMERESKGKVINGSTVPTLSTLHSLPDCTAGDVWNDNAVDSDCVVSTPDGDDNGEVIEYSAVDVRNGSASRYGVECDEETVDVSSNALQNRIETLEAKVCQLIIENQDLEMRMEQKSRLLITEQQLSSHYLEDLERTRRVNSCDLSHTMKHLQSYIEGEEDAKNAKKILYRSIKASKYRSKLGLGLGLGAGLGVGTGLSIDKSADFDAEKENRFGFRTGTGRMSLNINTDCSSADPSTDSSTKTTRDIYNNNATKAKAKVKDTLARSSENKNNRHSPIKRRGSESVFSGSPLSINSTSSSDGSHRNVNTNNDISSRKLTTSKKDKIKVGSDTSDNTNINANSADIDADVDVYGHTHVGTPNQHLSMISKWQELSFK